ncbi:MAG: carbohydrate kinase [Planctomycetes bacterium]|nr:carbohydrate kinase [Planctomycetota bacterium]
MEQKTVLSFGEILWDLLPDGPQLGGAPLNLACRVASLGERGRVASRLGCDDLGREACERVAALGVDTSLVQWDDDRPTGSVTVRLDARGNPDFTIHTDVAYDFIKTSDAMLGAAATADCICFGTLIQRNETSRRTLYEVLEAGQGALKLLDINLRRNCYDRGTVSSSLEAADIVKLNDGEVGELAGMFGLVSGDLAGRCVEMAARWSLSHCLVTLGEFGSLVASREGRIVYTPGYEVAVVDTCGCGDACTAGFLHGLLRGRSAGESCRLGNALGAMVAGLSGGTVRVTPSELERFVAGDHRRRIDARYEAYAAE